MLYFCCGSVCNFMGLKLSVLSIQWLAQTTDHRHWSPQFISCGGGGSENCFYPNCPLLLSFLTCGTLKAHYLSFEIMKIMCLTNSLFVTGADRGWFSCQQIWIQQFY